jgi:uncharacterized spore protein YtfJ
MEHLKQLFLALGQHFEKLARTNAVVGKPISVGDRHVVTLCELSLAFGGAGGTGEQDRSGKKAGKGMGGGAGGAAKARPVAVLVVEGGKARLERIGD